MKKIIITLLCCISCNIQAKNWYPINILSTANGLPTDNVKQIYQDKEGYIWIATRDGLSRYDGYQVKIYKSNLYTPFLFSNNKLNVIAEDNKNQIWIGTDNGLNLLLKTTGEVRQIPFDKLNNNNIQALLPTQQNNVWIGTENGLYQYLAEKDSFVYYHADDANHHFNSHNIKTLCEDSRGDVWIGTWNEGLFRLDAHTGVCYSYPQLNPQNSAHVIFEDKQHTIWIGTWEHGLVRLENPYDPEKVQYIRYMHDKNRPGSLCDNTVYALSQDLNTGCIWVGTKTGLSVLTDRNNPCSFTNYLQEQSGLSYSEVNSIICDNTGLMWLGFLGGGVNVVNTTETFFRSNTLDAVIARKAANNVRSLYVDPKGCVWMGIGSTGLVSYDRSSNQYTFYEDHPDFKRNPITSSIYHITQIGNAYWFATYGQGIFIYQPDKPSDRLTNISDHTNPRLSNTRIFYIHEDLNHFVWIGTTEGLCLYDPKTGKIESYDFHAVYHIVQSDRQTIWLATSGNGVVKLQIDSITSGIRETAFYTAANGKVNNDYILFIFKDSRGKLWMGSEGGGLNYYDEQRDAFICVQQEYNLPGDIVHNMVEDRQGRFWLGSNASLVLLANGNTRQFTVTNGLLNTYFNRNAFFQTPDGELFIGNHRGYNHFYPEELQLSEFVSPIVITDIKIYNKSLEAMDGKIRKKISANAPGYTGKICLPYDYNNFSIEFAALNYLNPAQNKYAYRLAEYDKEWQYTDASKRYASYNNLKSGSYTFYLKALNDSGAWSMGAPLWVEILPPFWLTWWAYLIYCTTFVLIVYFGIRITKNRLSMQNVIRMKDMETQKIEELNQMKFRFFTNISHEFRTPLSLIISPLEVLIKHEKDETYKQKLSKIHKNAQNLLGLVNQLLDFRKLEMKGEKLLLAYGNLVEFIEEFSQTFKEISDNEQKDINLSVNEEYLYMFFDKDKLRKILNNLLSNAFKHTSIGDSIMLSMEKIKQDNREYAVIKVSDSGKGIPPKSIDKIFDRFYQLENVENSKPGSGIGLHLVKEYVHLHEGHITVESAVGKGSVFTVMIPANLKKDAAETEIAVAACEKRITSNDNVRQTSGRKKVLVVEDNDEFRQFLTEQLADTFLVMEASNGEEGEQVALNAFPDLIITDIMMPKVDGIELCTRVKNNIRISHIPVILLTAHTSDESKLTGYGAGADEYLSKPFNFDILLLRIQKLIEQQEIRKEQFRKTIEVTPSSITFSSLDEQLIQKILYCIEQKMNDSEYSIDNLSVDVGLSRANMYRKIQSITGETPTDFIRSIRIKRAVQLLRDTKLNVCEIANMVGFNNIKYFNKHFKNIIGITPTQYRIDNT
jgi:signal transduction histidine kinase/DNA-binding response OmpR family regulator/streptogramin lyase